MTDLLTAQKSIADKNPARVKLGQYTLLEKIAQGGMAEVYKAKTVDASGIERLVVIKRILPHISSHPEYVDMLIDEAKIAVHFTHGNIAQVYDLGRAGKDYFIVMEYVDGKTFSQIYKMLGDRHQKIPLDVLLYGFIELCHGLAYIHRKLGPAGKRLGVVHRDISPQNIILSYTGNVKIIDFGVAKATFLEDKTETGVLKGKFAYMSPEQTKGEKLDHRSDIFSLGTLLWEMVTGERLFKRKVNKETIRAVQKAKFDLASTHRADVPAALDRILRKALGRSARSRYQDAEDMALDLEKLLMSINPDFRPITAAKFLYDLFGPATDESHLPPPFFVKTPVASASPTLDEKTEHQSILSAITPVNDLDPHSGDETTIKEFLAEVTPLVRVAELKHKVYHYRYRIFAVAILFVFFLGSGYVYWVHQKNLKASLSFRGLGPGMTVRLNGEIVAVPVDGGPLVVRSGTQYHIEVSQQGFKPFEANLILAPQEKRRQKVVMVKDIPPFGDVVADTTPPGAAIYLDERDSGLKTPATIPQLPIDKDYKIGFYLPGYDFLTRVVRVPAGKVLKLSESLVPKLPVVTFISEPAGAEIFVDGVSRGLTPLTLADLVPGEEYAIRVALPGHEPLEENHSFEPGAETSLSFSLPKAPPIP